MNFNDIFGNAEWVMPSRECNTPYFKDVFDIESVSHAEITVCGLGFYYLYINGKSVTEDLFVTLATDYHDHFNYYGEKFGHRIICQKYDVTELLSEGKNAVGMLVGGGYYRYCDDHKPVLYGRVRACYNLEVTSKDGKKYNFVSGEGTKWTESFITECDNFTLGETQDFTRERADWNLPESSCDGWFSVEKAEVPETEYEYMTSPADRIASTGKPKLISTYDGKKLYDVGENITGWAIIELSENSTEPVNVRFGEELLEGKFNEENCYGQYFKVIPDGKKRSTHPYLTWHGFRYVELSGGAEMTGFAVINSDVKPRTSFESSNKVLNWLYKTYLRTQLNNMHAGIPTDCPTIERRGYTGDGQLCAQAAMLLLDSKSFYRKWINDIRDCQDRISGHIQYTAPVISSGGGPGGWGCAIVEVPYMYYNTYGETDVLEECFQNMLSYFGYLDAHSENNLVVSDQPGAWCLGDWCTATETKIPEPYVNTYFYVKSINRVIEIAEVIGKQELIPELRLKADLLKKAIVNNYYDAESGDFCGGIQGSNVFGLDIGLGDERTFKHIVDFYSDYGMFDTGIFGTDILPRILFEKGEAELAYKLMSSEGKYSFGNWMNEGATTLWEYWTGERSHDHPMFGACTRYLFTYVLGIKQASGKAGYSDLIISPADISLEAVSGEIILSTGKLSVEINRSNDKTDFVINVPEGVNAQFAYKGIEKNLSAGINKITHS